MKFTELSFANISYQLSITFILVETTSVRSGLAEIHKPLLNQKLIVLCVKMRVKYEKLHEMGPGNTIQKISISNFSAC